MHLENESRPLDAIRWPEATLHLLGRLGPRCSCWAARPRGCTLGRPLGRSKNFPLVFLPCILQVLVLFSILFNTWMKYCFQEIFLWEQWSVLVLFSSNFLWEQWSVFQDHSIAKVNWHVYSCKVHIAYSFRCYLKVVYYCNFCDMCMFDYWSTLFSLMQISFIQVLLLIKFVILVLKDPIMLACWPSWAP